MLLPIHHTGIGPVLIILEYSPFHFQNHLTLALLLLTLFGDGASHMERESLSQDSIAIHINLSISQMVLCGKQSNGYMGMVPVNSYRSRLIKVQGKVRSHIHCIWYDENYHLRIDNILPVNIIRSLL